MFRRSATSEVQRTAPRYVRLFRKRLSAVLREYQINVVLDIGANSGAYGKLLRSIGYRGLIISCEPIERVFQQLARKARGDKLWHVHNVALGEKEGVKELNVAPWTEFSSFLSSNACCRENFGTLATPNEKVTVLVKTVQSLLEGRGLVGNNVYLKLDTQGYDIQVFMGSGLMASNILALQSELALVPIYSGMKSIGESLSFYRNAGFEVAGLWPVSQHKSSFIIYEIDCLIVRPRYNSAVKADDIMPFLG